LLGPCRRPVDRTDGPERIISSPRRR
jgi:hypothetical protein